MIQDIYPHKLNNQYHPDQKPDADSIILYFTQEGLLHRLLKKEDLEEMGQEDLFSLDEMIYTGDGKKLARPTLLNEEHLFLSFPRLSDFVNDTHVTEETLTYLFSVDDDNYFLLSEAPEEIPEDYEFNTVRELRNLQIGPKSARLRRSLVYIFITGTAQTVSVDAVDTRPFILPQNVL